MEFTRNVRTRVSLPSSSSSPYKRFFRSANLIRGEFKNFQYFERRDNSFEHTKRNLKGNVNSDINQHNVNNNNNENEHVNHNSNNNLISYEHLSESESWIDLVLPFTILAITILAVIFVAAILFIWIQKYFRERRDKSQIIEDDDRVQQSNLQYCAKKRCVQRPANSNRGKMNSRKWLKGNSSSSKQIENQTVNDDLEQKLETIEFKSTPPTSPNSQKLNEEESDDDDENADDEEQPQQQLESDCEEGRVGKSEIKTEKETAIIPCPLAITDISIADISIQPPQISTEPSPQFQQIAASSSSSLSFLQEEVHCIQPREDQSQKIYKSIATSPPPFSPIVAHHHALHHKYATTGTQTYFTKAPNSPNNLLSSSFAVLQTPTSASSSSFILSPTCTDNKENKEPSAAKLRNVCLNKTITSFKQDNLEITSTVVGATASGGGGGSNSSASSPSSVISTSPKVNTNVLQQQNSPKIMSVHTNTGSPLTVSSATQKTGNFFRFPDIETSSSSSTTPPSHMKASLLEKQNSMTTNTSIDSTDVPIIRTFENLSIESGSSDKESIILKIDEVESPAVDRSLQSVFADCTGSNRDYNNHLNNNNNNSENTLTIRRARLKSISLDSDGARLVEENLTMPVEELVEIASYNNKQITDLTESDDSGSHAAASAASCANNNNNNINNNRFNPKNIYNLTINLDFRDSSLDNSSSSGMGDINMNQDQQECDETDDGISRTPTMKYFKQKKAVSLDSDNQEGSKIMAMQQFAGKTASTETFNYYFGQSNSKMNSSISVPSTPKHLTSNKLKISSSEDRSGAHSVCGRYSRKLGSFEENPDDNSKLLHVTTATTTHTQQSYKTNLTASIQTLNISSSNLKTLPEIMSINDFDANQSLKPSPRIPPTSIPPSKSGILQRRSSNHSLTLNLDGSCGNLARGLSCSNYSLGNLHGSHLNIAGSNYNLQPNHRVVTVKKNLLQRRGSNTSLTLNIQGSNNNLNRFNSHSSLNITGSSQKKTGSSGGGGGGLLERRNSNASLTLNIQNRGLSISNCNLRGSECSLSSVNTNQMAELMMLEQEAEHQECENQGIKECDKYSRQRKFLSSENLHSIRSSTMNMSHGHRQPNQHPTPYGSIDNLKQTQPYHEKIPVISTKPLSPQSTSEDFKIYLANIQFLQSASNVLDEEQLETLNALFQKSYKSKESGAATGGCNNNSGNNGQQQQRQFNNDDILNSKYSTDGSIISFSGNSSTSSPDEDQKQLLIKLHQEFWNLPTNYQEKPMVFGSQSKNRYKTILPNEHSRVILQKEDGAQQEPYINANFIKGPDYTSDCYIATQGPMQNTVYEFWLMVMQNIQKKNSFVSGIQKIAMLTDFVESQRQKCAVYFPMDEGKFEVFVNTGLPIDETFVRDNLDKILKTLTWEKKELKDDEEDDMPKISFNFFIIKNNGLKQKNGYSIRKLTLYYGNNCAKYLQQYTIYHYWFPDWPDHRSPQDIDVLLDMSLELIDGDCTKDFINDDKKSMDKCSYGGSDRNPLPIIHCSAGIGRTGCLAAILNGLGQIRANSSNEGTSVDVLGIVCNLRLQRGGMVQNSEQYELIHRSLCLYQQKLKSNKRKK